LRIDLFNEIAVSGDNVLNLEREAVAGLRHGVHVEGPHHILNLLDQVLGFFCKAFSLTFYSVTPLAK
jgi:hypothetical protein